MLSVLFTGMLTSEPEERFDRRNRPITTVRMTALDAEGSVVSISAIAFGQAAVAGLAGLKCGDEVAIAGHASVNRWDKDGAPQFSLNVKVTRVMTMRDAGEHITPGERAQGIRA